MVDSVSNVDLDASIPGDGGFSSVDILVDGNSAEPKTRSSTKGD
jgi:hypothetical protein